eukprot:12884495-Prorocentrum_lima.AAC.1
MSREESLDNTDEAPEDSQMPQHHRPRWPQLHAAPGTVLAPQHPGGTPGVSGFARTSYCQTKCYK